VRCLPGRFNEPLAAFIPLNNETVDISHFSPPSGHLRGFDAVGYSTLPDTTTRLLRAATVLPGTFSGGNP
jgi:hypothetical protein